MFHLCVLCSFTLNKLNNIFVNLKTITSISLLIAVELVPLLSINFISVKLFECYFGPLVKCIDTWCYLKGDINCNYYYYKMQRVKLNALRIEPWCYKIHYSSKFKDTSSILVILKQIIFQEEAINDNRHKTPK